MEAGNPATDIARIFVIDDNLADSQITVLALEEVYPGAQIDFFEGGPELISYLERSDSKNPNIVFIDLNMPEMDGREVLLYLKQHKLKSFPIYFFSGTISHEMRTELMEMGADGAIEKPLGFFETISVLKSEFKLAKT